VFSALAAEISARIAATQALISTHDSLPPSERAALKGLVFVDLYATYEMSIKRSVQATLLIRADIV
jgi:hypothetical protein